MTSPSDAAVGVLFPGQGAQTVGMAGGLIDRFPKARERFDEASSILGYDLGDLCGSGPEEKLNATEFSQPALFVTGIAAFEALQESEPARTSKIVAAAGLSLGEYTAVCAAGGLTFADGVRVVQARGRAMQAAADAVESGMASVLGLSLEELEGVCRSVRRDDEILQPANLLCPGNIAVSGHGSALERLEAAASDAGATRVVPLSVAGAFHTPIMESAIAPLGEALAAADLCDTSIPVYSNVDAAPHTSAAEIRELLTRQVTAPVLWEASLRAMIKDGVERFEELGTGRVLRGTLKRVERKFPADGFGDF